MEARKLLGTHLVAGRSGSDIDGGEKVIPWAEGNGLWHTVSQLISDLPGVDIATLFVQNPYTCDSAEGLAGRIGRQVSQVRAVLDGLAQAGLLQAIDLGDLRVYELTDDLHCRQTLQQYVIWLREGYHWTRMALDLG